MCKTRPVLLSCDSAILSLMLPEPPGIRHVSLVGDEPLPRIRRSAASARSPASGSEVLLRRHDLVVPEPLLHDLDVGTAGEEPRGMCRAKVVEGHLVRDLGIGEGRPPGLGAEVVA